VEVVADRTAAADCNFEEHNLDDSFEGLMERAGEDAASALAEGVVEVDRVEGDRAAVGHVAEDDVHSATGDLNNRLQDQELVGLCMVQNSVVHYSQLADLDLVVDLEHVVGRCILRLPAGCKGKTRENLPGHHDSRLCLHEEHPHRVATAGVGVAAHIRTEDAAVGNSQEVDRVAAGEGEGSCTVGLQTFSAVCNPTEAPTRRKESRAGEQNESCGFGNEKCGLPMSNER
jgi:hypothetical protein